MLYIHTTYGCAASTNVVDTHTVLPLIAEWAVSWHELLGTPRVAGYLPSIASQPERPGNVRLIAVPAIFGSYGRPIPANNTYT